MVSVEDKNPLLENTLISAGVAIVVGACARWRGYEIRKAILGGAVSGGIVFACGQILHQVRSRINRQVRRAQQKSREEGHRVVRRRRATHADKTGRQLESIGRSVAGILGILLKY